VHRRSLLLARPGPAEVLTIRQLSGGKRTDLKRAALSRFVRTRLDIVPWGRISALVPINALLGSEIGPPLGHRAARLTETIQMRWRSIGRNGCVLANLPRRFVGGRVVDDLERPNCSGCDNNFLQRQSPVHASTYVENVAGQVRPRVRERLPAAVLTVWSLRDAICWPGR
jgi:hypothetical protein